MADSGCEDTVPSAPLLKMPEESDASMRARLFNSLSQSFPHSQLYKALHGEADLILGGDTFDDDDDDSLYGDHLSNSCFASLRMDRTDIDDLDDDLQSLEWLQREDLLKNIGGEKLDRDDFGEEQKENEDIKPDINVLQGPGGPIPPHLPYQPQKHVNTKPPYSFSCLIFMAVENSPQKRLPVKDIYNWILTQFPYFQNAPTGWKNSVRHNLSLNKCFKKVDKDKGQSIGKGSLWCIDPAYRPNLLQALRKTPYHPYHQLQMTSTAPQHYMQMQFQSLPSGCRSVLPLTQRPIPNTVSPHLFPFLSRRLAQTSFDIDNEMKDVAQTLVSLKSFHKDTRDNSPGPDIGPTWKYHKKIAGSYKHRSESPVTITSHPHSDHAYSSSRILDDDIPSPSSSSSIDEEYDFGSDGDGDGEAESDFQSDMDSDSDSDDKDEVDGDIPSPKRLKIATKYSLSNSASKPKKSTSIKPETDDDEQKKIHEGASALLNLAGLFVNNDSSSNDPKKPVVKAKDKKVIKKVDTKKTKAVSQTKKIVAKKKVLKKNPEKPQDKKVKVKQRSGSKRKNAGSNGKYDNDEFTSFKGTKNMDKKSKSVKAENEDGGDKGSKNKNNLKKGHDKTKKLKLSKSFSAANKLSKTSKGSDKPVNKTSKLKKETPEKRSLKRALGQTLAKSKRAKTSNDNCVHESSKLLTTNNNNNNTVKKEPIFSRKNKEEAQNGRDCNGLDTFRLDEIDARDITTKEIVLQKEIGAAGDAPVVCKQELSPDGWRDGAESDVNKFLSSFGLVATTSSSSSSSSSSPATPAPPPPSAPAPALHKSPHFTRFSKKKAAFS